MKSMNKIRHTFVYRVFKNKFCKITFWTTSLSQHQTGKQRSCPGMVQENFQPVESPVNSCFPSNKMTSIGINVCFAVGEWYAQASPCHQQCFKRKGFIMTMWVRNPKMSVFWAPLEAESQSELRTTSLQRNYIMLSLQRFEHCSVIWRQVMTVDCNISDGRNKPLLTKFL
jgi:hypothetical protein